MKNKIILLDFEPMSSNSTQSPTFSFSLLAPTRFEYRVILIKLINFSKIKRKLMHVFVCNPFVNDSLIIQKKKKNKGEIIHFIKIMQGRCQCEGILRLVLLGWL